MPPSVLDRSLLGMSHPVLDLGEGLFDRIEVRRVWREEPEPGAGRLDHVSDGCRLVRAEVVHDDDVTWFEDGDELSLDIGMEASAVDRSVEDAGCGEPVAAQRPDKDERAPVAMRGEAAQAFALRPPAS